MPFNSPTGYFVKCNLHFPIELHALHDAYLLTPEHVHIDKEMLSDTLLLTQDVTAWPISRTRNWSPTCATRRATSSTTAAWSLISPTDFDWTRFVALSRSLSTPTCSLSSVSVLQLRAVIIQADRQNVLQQDGRKSTQARQRLSDRRLLKFVCTISKATYKYSSVINEDMAMVENFCAKVVLTKPIAVGCATREFAKLVKYEFYYDCLLPTFWIRL